MRIMIHLPGKKKYFDKIEVLHSNDVIVKKTLEAYGKNEDES